MTKEKKRCNAYGIREIRTKKKKQTYTKKENKKKHKEQQEHGTKKELEELSWSEVNINCVGLGQSRTVNPRTGDPNLKRKKISRLTQVGGGGGGEKRGWVTEGGPKNMA